MAKNLPANAGHIRDAGSFSWSGRSPGGGHGNPLQYSCLKNPHGQRNLAGYSPWGPKETRLRDCIYMCLYTHTHVCVHARLSKLHMYICMCACSVLCVTPRACRNSRKSMRLPPRHEMRPDSPALHAEQLRFPNQTHKEPRFA